MEVKEEIRRLDNNIQALVEMNKERHERDIKRDEILNSLHTIIKGDSNIQYVGVLERMNVLECALKNVTDMFASAKTIKNFLIVWVGGSLAAFGSFIYFMLMILDHIKK